MAFRIMNCIAALAAPIALWGLPAAALPLAPGGVIAPAGTTSAARPELGGIVINDNLLAFAIDPTPITPFTNVAGAVQNRVSVSNVTGDLIFGPRIRDTLNIDGGTFFITSFLIDGWGSFTTDVDFRTDGDGDTGFSSVSRSADGNRLTFRFDTPLQIDAIAPGAQEESLFPAILTDARSFNTNGRMRIIGYLGGDPNTIFSTEIGGIAVPQVPLPAGLWLSLAAFGALGAMRRRQG
ncbi:hypothetical protein DKT77_17275 [Meridianimarinicoccus roseus]|uniref:VPLPA-CTERM sorting domain-containing protein n=1 Tax=Meridianimarinicoccus roseus TaxID=2072018 RepID=A0A2V2L814_9RHOB|nr:VPLPA-CTERM sorting domain-containing protein [Meridianimarinicoccus roseus]PWR01315.1 hypothetical protein DKT77_17275 [Meridianimarinicoccus roseus]